MVGLHTLCAKVGTPSSRFEHVDPKCLPCAIPTLPELIMLFNSYVCGKGFGESLICTDVFKRFPVAMAKFFFPLYVKSYVRIQPPLQWQGGHLCEWF